ncbi:family transcriptional regulator : Transcriptional regulators OS=Comamonadaceae bacterium B1 GN=SMCB_1614 PE=4 SV=1: MarR_2 [Gemmata massiliana]|uniref:HTH marR-type domain-containing protein n=1 Tax=Gemmata massiliana TaxID=1210884 RepID=A0A6P2DAU4_9BACT|nr:MarR family winged helix-turn-helix transcriptional regulator [Gemmata massiliana]VTR98027.1 family transcriptional regulator : Transcriptional regulators OS=Comamonadaceae bacterium B1 GN=SMCB_1614 PE=4 SV=1: MarR_2 [Gemmata massiliana]
MYNIDMQEESPERRFASECLAGRVRILNRIVTGIYDDALRPHGVRISQMNVLVAIAVLGPVRAAQICTRLCLDKSTLSRDLDRLLARKLVTVARAEGRTQHLEITDAGRELIAKVKPAWEVAQQRTREVLGTTLTEGLFEALDRLREDGGAS